MTYNNPIDLTELESELHSLHTIRRMEISLQLQETMGETEETKNLIALQEQVSFEGHIRDLERPLANYRFIEPGHNNDNVQLGSTLVFRENGNDTETYSIIGTAKANPQAGNISDESPQRVALLESKVGDDIEINAPGGLPEFQVVSFL